MGSILRLIFPSDCFLYTLHTEQSQKITEQSQKITCSIRPGLHKYSCSRQQIRLSSEADVIFQNNIGTTVPTYIRIFSGILGLSWKTMGFQLRILCRYSIFTILFSTKTHTLTQEREKKV